MTSFPHSARLLPHAISPCPALNSVDVSVQRTQSRLTLRYRLQGELSALVIPAPSSPEQRDGLWQHTCCEAFIRIANDEPYREFNFSPAGHWAAYGFTGYRAGMQSLSIQPLIRLERTAQTLQLTATIALPTDLHHRSLQLGLSAVIEARDSELSYWALAHSGERPDFHHRAGHCLVIEALA